MSHILLLNTNLETGGAERQLVQLVRYWPRSDVLSVVLLERKGTWISEIPPDVPVFPLTERMPQAFLTKVFWAMKIVSRIRQWLLENPSDIVLTFLWLPTVLVALALRGLPNPPLLVWSVQSDLGKELSLHWNGWLRSWLVRTFLASRVARFICVSEGICHRTQTFLRTSIDKFVVIPNSVDLDRVRRMAKASESTRPKRAAVRLVSVGRLHPAKGMDVLIYALSEVLLQSSEWECYILGDGPERQQLIKLVNKLGLGDHIFFVGHTPNPYAWLRTADVFISASRWETFGIAILEAMALGIPVIATTTDGAQDIIGDGVSGLFVPVDNVPVLAQAISDLIREPSLRRELSMNAKENAQRFDAPLIAQQYAELTANILRE